MPLAKNQVRKKHPGYIVITLGHPSKQSNSFRPLCISNNGLYLAFISLNRKFSKTCSLIYFQLGRAKMVSDLKIYMRNKPLTLLAFFSKKTLHLYKNNLWIRPHETQWPQVHKIILSLSCFTNWFCTINFHFCVSWSQLMVSSELIELIYVKIGSCKCILDHIWAHQKWGVFKQNFMTVRGLYDLLEPNQKNKTATNFAPRPLSIIYSVNQIEIDSTKVTMAKFGVSM